MRTQTHQPNPNTERTRRTGRRADILRRKVANIKKRIAYWEDNKEASEPAGLLPKLRKKLSDYQAELEVI